MDRKLFARNTALDAIARHWREPHQGETILETTVRMAAGKITREECAEALMALSSELNDALAGLDWPIAIS